MKRFNSYRFYQLAKKLLPILQMNDEVKFKECFYDLLTARLDLYSFMEEIPLRVSHADCDRVIKHITAIVPMEFREVVSKLNEKTQETCQIKPLKGAIEKLEAVLSSEVRTLDIYRLEQKGAYSTDDLLERAEIMFPKNIREIVPSAAIVEWKEAGRCLVIDAPTAAGFHVLRAVELVMALYYAETVAREDSSKKWHWGAYIDKLKKANANPRITALLDHIRDSYRNPVAHPQDVLTADEAEALMGVSNSCIRLMALEVAKLRQQEKASSKTAKQAKQ